VWDSRKRGLAVGRCYGKRQSVRINVRTIWVPLDAGYFNSQDAILLSGKYGRSKLYSSCLFSFSFKERPVPPPYTFNHLSALRGGITPSSEPLPPTTPPHPPSLCPIPLLYIKGFCRLVTCVNPSIHMIQPLPRGYREHLVSLWEGDRNKPRSTLCGRS